MSSTDNPAYPEPDEPEDAWEQFLQQYEWKQLKRHHPELADLEESNDG